MLFRVVHHVLLVYCALVLTVLLTSVAIELGPTDCGIIGGVDKFKSSWPVHYCRELLVIGPRKEEKESDGCTGHIRL